MKTICLMAILLAAACAGAANWTKPGATQEDFAGVKWQCLRDAKALNDDHSWASGLSQKRIFEQCMSDHGWRKTT